MKQLSAKDLRIGNLLQTLEGDITSVTEIITASNLKDSYFWCHDYNDSQVKPIELTEEWLIKAKFKHQKPFGTSNLWSIKIKGYWYSVYEKNEIWYMDIHLPVILQSIHHLQNIIYYLTNFELNIKL